MFQGDGALTLLNHYQHLALLLVDQWKQTPQYAASGDPTYAHVGDMCHQLVQHRVQPYDDRVHVWRGSSSDAAAMCDLYFYHYDFVFIDAEHTYDEVLADCRAWWSKVKPGGWLCGHDYGNPGEHVKGVVPAVDRFAKELSDADPRIELQTTGAAGDWTWWIRKP